MLKQDLYECDVAFVIGYSMADPDLAEIFFNSDDLLNKCFVFSGIADELAAHRISLIGRDTKLGVEDLARLARERPSAPTSLLRSELIADRGTFDTAEISQTARQSLLIFGRFDSNVARTSWATNGPEYVVRRQVANTLATLTSPQIAVVHSHLGNGKGLVFEYAKFLRTRKNVLVYTVKPDVDDERLADVLGDVPVGSHVFYEGDIFSVHKTIKVVIERSLVFCASSRTTTVRVAMPVLAKAAAGRRPASNF